MYDPSPGVKAEIKEEDIDGEPVSPSGLVDAIIPDSTFTSPEERNLAEAEERTRMEEIAAIKAEPQPATSAGGSVGGATALATTPPPPPPFIPRLQSDVRYASPAEQDAAQQRATEQDAARRRLRHGPKTSSANKMRRVHFADEGAAAAASQPSAASQPGTRGTPHYHVTNADWDARQQAKAAALAAAASAAPEPEKGKGKGPGKPAAVPPPYHTYHDRPSHPSRGHSPHSRQRPYPNWQGAGKGKEKGWGKGQDWQTSWWETPSDWSRWSGTGRSRWQEPANRGGYYTKGGEYRDYY